MKITPAETRVMDVLWRLGPVDAGQVTAALADSEGWEEATVRTLLRRLIARKAVAKTKEGRRAVYRPLVDRAAVAAAESETLIDRFYGGLVSPLVVQFAERRKLSPEDIAALKRLIAELDDDD